MTWKAKTPASSHSLHDMTSKERADRNGRTLEIGMLFQFDLNILLRKEDVGFLR